MVVAAIWQCTSRAPQATPAACKSAAQMVLIAVSICEPARGALQSHGLGRQLLLATGQFTKSHGGQRNPQW